MTSQTITPQIKSSTNLSSIKFFPIFLSLVLFIIIFFSAVFIGYKSNLIKQKTPEIPAVEKNVSDQVKKYCESNGGKWLSDYNECENGKLTQSECESLGGSFSECNSACRHDSGYPDDVVCIDVCVKVCQFK